MTPASDDPVLRQLARMTPAVPDPIHSASVRARCHVALARQRRSRTSSGEVRGDRGRLFELAIVGGVTLFYVSLVIRDALAVHGVL